MSREARCRCRQVGEGLGAQQAELDCSGQAARPGSRLARSRRRLRWIIYSAKNNWKTQCEHPGGGASRRRGRVDPGGAPPPPVSGSFPSRLFFFEQLSDRGSRTAGPGERAPGAGSFAMSSADSDEEGTRPTRPSSRSYRGLTSAPDDLDPQAVTTVNLHGNFIRRLGVSLSSLTSW